MPGVSPQRATSESSNKESAPLRDSLPLLITVVAGVVCYGLFWNRGLGLSVIGYSIAPAERVMQGEVPYRDFLFNYTPGILWVNALLMKFFGATLVTTRVGLFVFKLATLIILFVIGRRLTNSWIALLPVGLTLAWLGHQQIFNVYPDQYLVLCALAALMCMLKFNESDASVWLLMCGLMVGSVFLFKYNVGVLLLGAGGLSIVLKESLVSRSIRRVVTTIGVYLVGFGLIAGALIVYLYSNHALGAMINHFLHHAAEYSETRSVTLPPIDLVLPVVLIYLFVGAFGALVLLVPRLFVIYFVAAFVVLPIVLMMPGHGDVTSEGAIELVAYFPPAIFGLSILLALWRLRNKARDLPGFWRENGELAITGLFAVAVYLEVFPRADFYHLVRVLPPVFLFSVALAFRLQPSIREQLSKLKTSVREKLGKALPATSLANSIMVVATPLVFLVFAGVRDTWVPEFESFSRLKDSHQLNIDRGRGILVEDKQGQLTEGLVQLIQANSAPDDYVFSFAQRGSALYFLAARRNPTKILLWRSVGISSEERNAVMNMVTNRRAKLIVVQDVAATQEIQDFIGDNYDQIGAVADIAVYGLKDRRAAGSIADQSKPFLANAFRQLITLFDN